jgi:hypothetical protein
MKAQGLPISAVIIIVLAVTILVLIVVFVILPVIHVSSSLKPPSSSDSAFSFTCSTACSTATNPSPADTSFCKDTMPSYSSIHCYSQIPGSSNYFYGTGSCSYTDSFGKTVIANASTC